MTIKGSASVIVPIEHVVARDWSAGIIAAPPTTSLNMFALAVLISSRNVTYSSSMKRLL